MRESENLKNDSKVSDMGNKDDLLTWKKLQKEGLGGIIWISILDVLSLRYHLIIQAEI